MTFGTTLLFNNAIRFSDFISSVQRNVRMIHDSCMSKDKEEMLGHVKAQYCYLHARTE